VPIELSVLLSNVWKLGGLLPHFVYPLALVALYLHLLNGYQGLA